MKVERVGWFAQVKLAIQWGADLHNVHTFERGGAWYARFRGKTYRITERSSLSIRRRQERRAPRR